MGSNAGGVGDKSLVIERVTGADNDGQPRAAAPEVYLEPNVKGGHPVGDHSRVRSTGKPDAVSLQSLAPWQDPAIGQRFPTIEQIPERFRVNPNDNPPVFMIDGKVETFTGENRSVYSRIGVRTDQGIQAVYLGEEPQLTAVEAKRAVAAADRAYDQGFGQWPRASTATRIAAVEKLAERIEAQTDRIATLLMYEIGKPWAAARKEVSRSVEYIRDTIAVLERMEAAADNPIEGKKGQSVHHAFELRKPLGKVLCVAPFNYPVNEFLTTIVPALLMGNTVIAKTPRFGSLANQVLAQAFADSFPPGTVSLLPGSGRTLLPEIMKSDPPIKCLAFIGSEGAANAVMSHHPDRAGLHKVLGLGAKNPAVVLEGADHDAVIEKIVKGALGFNGQRCTAEKVIYVPRAQAEAFAKKLAARVDGLKVGMPWEEGVAITPLPESDKLDRMRAMIDDATQKGAEIVNKKGGTGFHSLMKPAVLFPVDERMTIFHKEQFGPIVPVVPYDDIEQVIRWQRASPYGQQAGVWGPPEAAASVVRDLSMLNARVNLNDVCQRGPDAFGFTATDKSGFGVLSLEDALMTFSRPALVQSTDLAGLKTVR